MRQRQFQKFSNNAFWTGGLVAVLVLSTFFLVRFFIGQARSQELKAQSRVELLKYAQLLEDDIANQAVLVYGLDAFLAADEDDNLEDPELISEIEAVSRALAKRSTLVNHVFVATGDPNQARWRSGYEVHLQEETEDSHLQDKKELSALAKTTSKNSEIYSQIMIFAGKRQLVIAKAVYRNQRLWGYIFASVKLENLVRDAFMGFEERAYQVGLDFSSAPLQPDAVIAPVKTFGEPWQLTARPTNNWRDPLFSFPAFLSLAGLAALILGVLVYFSTFESKKSNWLAFYDNLTGAGNRRYLEAEFQKLAARGTFGLILFDIDNFKKINETYSFAVGDQVLIEVADRIQKQLESGQVLGRLGNDEFVVLSGLGDSNALDELAGRVQRAMSEPLLFNKNMISLITNIGISRYPIHDTSLGGLIEHADHHTVR
jgi:diguanylate cyclase (GGDEF)-like protein